MSNSIEQQARRDAEQRRNAADMQRAAWQARERYNAVFSDTRKK